MIRAVGPDGRIETGGAFRPIARPRVLDRIAAAAAQRIVLLLAPAGYGKTIALRQFLETVEEPVVRYDLQAEHGALLGFVRGFADALVGCAPDARKTCSGAYERSRSSATPGLDLAVWLQAHLAAFRGTIAIDDLHRGESEPEISRLLETLIERTKTRVRWVISSRSPLGLPIGTWLAYQDADLAVDDRDLRFTAEEARTAARALRVAVRDEELNDLLTLTDGWPTALGFALRSSTHSSDLRNVRATTRELIYRYLAEQVYRSLSDDERVMLAVASMLPQIEVTILERAGFERPLAMLEELHRRVAFIYEERPGVYGCHELFRDFLTHELSIDGASSMLAYRLRAAKALEATGKRAAALGLYVDAGADDEVGRCLRAHGFELLEQGYADTVGRAVAALGQTRLRSDGIVLALRGLLESHAGRFDRAQSLMRRALAAGLPVSLRARVALKLSSLLFNQGRHPGAILEPLRQEAQLSVDLRAELEATLAAIHARAGETEAARSAAAAAEIFLEDVEDEAVRAGVLQRLGIVAFELEEYEFAKQRYAGAADLASSLGLHSLAARAFTGLSTTAIVAENDLAAESWYAQQAAEAAAKAGDVLDLHTAYVQLLDGEIRRGDRERAVFYEERLAQLRTSDPARSVYLAVLRAHRLAWEGNFSDAHRLAAAAWDRLAHPSARLVCGALCAVYFAADGRSREAGLLVEHITASLQGDEGRAAGGEYGRHAALFCALAEVVAGRSTSASRLLRIGPGRPSAVIQALERAVSMLLACAHHPSADWERARESCDAFHALGYGGYARLCEALIDRLAQTGTREQAVLTPAEVDVLRRLAGGRKAKEIAAETGRSVHTIQAHVQNAIEKLGCHGRSEAITVARRLGVLDGA
ncbi:MAG: LuxR C-terminal-related transcriptional regulator [Vulcanimicrobiaceae bacterium]